MAILKFHRRSGGTGAIINTVELGLDEGTPIDGEYRQIPDSVLTKIEARFHFFPAMSVATDATFNEARRLVVAELERLRTALAFRAVNVKTLARNVAVIPNVHDNFGDLVFDTTSGDSVILDNCCLMDSAVTDDSAAIQGITLSLTFGRVCDALQPA